MNIKAMNIKTMIAAAAAALMMAGLSLDADACTGITLEAADGSRIIARTCEWGGDVHDSRYVIVPRGFRQRSLTPEGENGMKFTSRYGYAGISVVDERFIMEGLNEKGLSIGLYYFPGYGEYRKYDPECRKSTLTDMQFVPWVLGNFSSISELEEAVEEMSVAGLVSEKMTVHWSVADRTGRQVVIEVVGGKMLFKENPIGVITNAPEFEWQMTNLNNYVHLFTGSAQPREIAPGVTLKSIGVGSAALGLPGDVTPPSRFVRAAYYKTTAPVQKNGHEAMKQAFQILNNFDIPIGIEHEPGKAPEELISATQWTSAADQKNLKFYYRTQWNSTIRCIDFSRIDFNAKEVISGPLEKVLDQPVEYLEFN